MGMMGRMGDMKAPQNMLPITPILPILLTAFFPLAGITKPSTPSRKPR
jgi:hypothetical protein